MAAGCAACICIAYLWALVALVCISQSTKKHKKWAKRSMEATEHTKNKGKLAKARLFSNAARYIPSPSPPTAPSVVADKSTNPRCRVRISLLSARTHTGSHITVNFIFRAPLQLPKRRRLHCEKVLGQKIFNLKGLGLVGKD